MTEPAEAGSGMTEFLAGGGEMGRLIRSMDWSQTPLGPIERWPQSLRTTVSLCLASNFPINIIWGRSTPRSTTTATGRSAAASIPRPWGRITRVLGLGMARHSARRSSGSAGHSAYLENQRMFLTATAISKRRSSRSRSARSATRAAESAAFPPGHRNHRAMLVERRTRALRDLADRTGEMKTVEDVCAPAARTLADYDLDLPFTLLYLIDDGGSVRRLAAIRARSPEPMPARELEAGRRARRTPTECRWPLAHGRGPAHPFRWTIWSAVSGRCPAGLPGTAADGAFCRSSARRRRAPRGSRGRRESRLPLDEAYRAFCRAGGGSGHRRRRQRARLRGGARRAEALAEIDRAKTAFFSNVSHEFRTPLTLMLGPWRMRSRTPTDRCRRATRTPAGGAPQRPAPAEARQRSARLLAHRSGARRKPRYEPVDLAALTADLASSFRSACERAGLALSVDCPPLPEPVHIDRAMWETIVLNLLSNAFKFTLSGGIASV